MEGIGWRGLDGGLCDEDEAILISTKVNRCTVPMRWQKASRQPTPCALPLDARVEFCLLTQKAPCALATSAHTDVEKRVK